MPFTPRYPTTEPAAQLPIITNYVNFSRCKQKTYTPAPNTRKKPNVSAIHHAEVYGEHDENVTAADLALARRIGLALAADLPAQFDRDDILQAASIGVWKAKQRFNPLRNNDFAGYAYNYIRYEVLMWVRRGNWQNTVHMGRLVLVDDGDRPPTEEYSQPCDAHPLQDDNLNTHQMARLVCSLLQFLPPSQEFVIRALFLDGATWSDVIDALHMSRRSVFLLRRAALANLRTLIRDRGLDVSNLVWH
jgi:RNA polymerase sigma factor (sigma-70 family)